MRKVYLKELDSFLVILFRVGVPSRGAVMSVNRFLLVSTTGCAFFALELSRGVTLSEVALALTCSTLSLVFWYVASSLIEIGQFSKLSFETSSRGRMLLWLIMAQSTTG